MKFKAKTVSIILCVIMTVALTSGCATPVISEDNTASITTDTLEETSDLELATNVTAGILNINKHGNVRLKLSFDDMRAANMDITDIITVTVGNNSYDMPIGTVTTDVEDGEMICCFDPEDSTVKLVINYGSFAEDTGLATKETIEADPGYKWVVNIPTVTLCLKEKGGYTSEYSIRHLTYTADRKDYLKTQSAHSRDFNRELATA